MVRLNAARQSGVPSAAWCEWAEHTCWASGASQRGRAGSEQRLSTQNYNCRVIIPIFYERHC
eukprot:6095115-Pleurochrysis_carterae.AAC.1